MSVGGAQLDLATTTAIARRFHLGEVLADAVPAAAGWAGHNVVWRLTTQVGTWAVKELGREPVEPVEAAARLEAEAYRAGIPAPRPIPGREGHWLVNVEGRTFRCHQWVTGVDPTDDLTDGDASRAGRCLGRLHRLGLRWHEGCMSAPHVWGKRYWLDCVERADRVGFAWATQLAERLEMILAMEAASLEWVSRPHRFVGSHRDVRPGNTLRAACGLLLVDWDSAGPAVPGREVAGVLRWWSPYEDEFLAGYTEVAGEVDLQESKGENGGMVWWLETNVRLALARPEDVDRQKAVSALLGTFD